MKIKAMIVDSSINSRRKLLNFLYRERYIDIVCEVEDEKEAGIMLDLISPDIAFVNYEILKRSIQSHGLIELFHKKNIFPLIHGVKNEEIKDFKKAVFFPLPYKRENLIKLLRQGRKLNIEAFLNEKRKTAKSIVVIASSAGGPPALRKLISALPENFPAPIIVVQHIGKGFTENLAKSINKISRIRVKVAENGEIIQPETVFIAPSGYHFCIGNGRIILESCSEAKENRFVPSADEVMKSVAENYGGGVIGIILSGMGGDGIDGVKKIKKRGGEIIVQNKASSAVFSMPYAALKTKLVDRVLDINTIPEVIIQKVYEKHERKRTLE